MTEFLHPYQREAVNTILRLIHEGQQQIYISMPAGTGKTTILFQAIYEYCKKHTSKNPRILIVYYHRNAINYALAYLQKHPFNQFIVSEMSDGSNSPIQVTTFNKITNKIRSNQVPNKFDIIAFDGVENYGINETEPSKTTQILNLFAHSSIILGLGESLSNSNPFFKKADFVYTLRKGIDDGYFRPLLISRLKLPEPYNKLWQDVKQKEDVLIKSAPGFFTELAKSIRHVIQKDKSLVICRRIAFGNLLSAAFNGDSKNSLFSTILSTQIDSTEANEILNKFENHSSPSVLITTATSLKGLGFRNVRYVVLLENIISQASMEVILSRAMRTSEGGAPLHILDFAENDFSPYTELKKDNQIHLDNRSFSKNETTYVNKTQLKFKKKGSVDGVLGVVDLADELAGIIRSMPDDQGAMIGIFGKWGRGKTFLLEQTWNQLKSEKFFRVDYHAWKYQDTPASWAYLYENLSQGYLATQTDNRILTAFLSAQRLIKLNIKRKGYLPILKAVAFILFGLTIATISYFLSERIKLNIGVGILSMTLMGVVTFYKIWKEFRKEYSSQAKDLFLKYSQKYSLKDQLGLQAEIQKEILVLLKTWIPNSKVGQERVLLFIDDIDRCDESKIMQVIDSLRVMLEDEVISRRLVIVTAVDERILKRAIRSKYRNSLSDDYNAHLRENILNTIAHEYIDKVFLVGIKLGDLSYNERQEFFLAFADGDMEVQQTPNHTNTDPISHIEDTADETMAQTPPSEIEATFPSEDSADKKKLEISFKLSSQEVDILLQSLEQFTSATPRQICIFYYRYLITKNLLVRQYNKLDRENIWLIAENSKLLVDLIVLYSMHEDHTLVNDHKVSVLQTTAPKCKVFLKNNTSFNSKDYGELLRVLDIVLAY